jgi:hypothetical protein
MLMTAQNAQWSDSLVKSEMEELLSLRAEVLSLLEEARNDKWARALIASQHIY